MSLNNKDRETKGLIAMMIIEVLGKPPEHLKETLEEIIKKIDAEKGVSVIFKKINEPVLMKEQKEFYTSFAEIEIEVEEILHLAILMFKYMPAHIEIISPELIALTNNGWNDVLNELTRRLHGYDEVARIIQVEKNILEKKLRVALENKKKEEK
ncbi:MAG: hypothetical protein KJ646_02460 [Nanoarchaeota archaeon]|nr:hypothetical protein [Nanoarchaeota archaeon]MBU4116210.1 hypothetical protein [Nanoarchaeota archaeon]